LTQSGPDLDNLYFLLDPLQLQHHKVRGLRGRLRCTSPTHHTVFVWKDLDIQADAKFRAMIKRTR